MVTCKRLRKDDLHSSLNVAELAGVSPVGFLPSNVVSSVAGSRCSPWIWVYPKRPEAVRRSQGTQIEIPLILGSDQRCSWYLLFSEACTRMCTIPVVSGCVTIRIPPEQTRAIMAARMPMRKKAVTTMNSCGRKERMPSHTCVCL